MGVDLVPPAVRAHLDMWSGLYPDDPMNVASTCESFLDLTFGKRTE